MEYSEFQQSADLTDLYKLADTDLGHLVAATTNVAIADFIRAGLLVGGHLLLPLLISCPRCSFISVFCPSI